MNHPPPQPRDPIAWCVAMTAAFLGLCLVRLTVPSTTYFDEIHYLPAARELLAMHKWINREHPMFGKEMIALGMWALGDNPLGWRIGSALAGTLTFFACMRALWFASLSRFATISYGVLLASGFMLFVQSQIAMLDAYMLAALATSFWMFAKAVREPEHGRRYMIAGGIAIGVAMGTKWNAVPLALVPGLTFFAWRLRATGWRFVWSRRGPPVPGVTLLEAALWLGVLPLLVYWATFAPAYFFSVNPLKPGGFFAYQHTMLALQESVIKPHPYNTRWWQWALDLRGIWYLYRPIDGVQRGVIMIGNPLTMITGLVAFFWCLWAGVRGRWDALAAAILYIFAIGFWVIAPKPIQFFYHYLAPSLALFAGLALALDELWRRGWRWVPVLFLAASCGIFVWFYPIISAAGLHDGRPSYIHWMWLYSWR
ncbi:phospholipid carrier-dependent glycosyltransferase [Tsuneonella mangrovi]|uniref:phospholipid carrier-dependent glycosyltransferase n=1 Tax=Tsuneonella mangrovi TaxID=1982042 RepID=UPI000BA1F5C0|nr:phospholipid carrier-dependent glycosyltransferase [Tsuneonella mangrovi]